MVEGEAGERLACRAVEHAERALLCGWDMGARLHGLDLVLRSEGIRLLRTGAPHCRLIFQSRSRERLRVFSKTAHLMPA